MKQFDRSRLRLLPLRERVHDLDMGSVKPLTRPAAVPPALSEAGRRMREARARGSASVFIMGGHVIRAGVQRYLIDLIERKLITCVAMNGSCVIHDFEMALIGATTESVAKYVAEGQFGLWQETGQINEIVNAAHRTGDMGLGEAVGKAILGGEFANKYISVLAACARLGVPATVHVGIGYDIIHEMPNFDGAATGALSYTDFLRFTEILRGLDGGIAMNFGSAVMAPEVFLKALSMARNVAHQDGKRINKFTTLVCDLRDLPTSFTAEPPKTSEGYYFRPWKTMLVRTVADGGESLYVKGNHADTVPALWAAATEGD